MKVSESDSSGNGRRRVGPSFQGVDVVDGNAKSPSSRMFRGEKAHAFRKGGSGLLTYHLQYTHNMVM